jgi:hypothetical protein
MLGWRCCRICSYLVSQLVASCCLLFTSVLQLRVVPSETLSKGMLKNALPYESPVLWPMFLVLECVRVNSGSLLIVRERSKSLDAGQRW